MLSGLAQAQNYTYTYKSAPFYEFVDGNGYLVARPAIFAKATQLTIQLNFANKIPAYWDGLVNPTSWTMSDGVGKSTSAALKFTNGVRSTSFYLTTDGNGTVSGWTIKVSDSKKKSAYIGCSGTYCPTGSSTDYFTAAGLVGGVYYYDVALAAPGRWTQP